MENFLIRKLSSRRMSRSSPSLFTSQESLRRSSSSSRVRSSSRVSRTSSPIGLARQHSTSVPDFSAEKDLLIDSEVQIRNMGEDLMLSHK